MNLSQVIEAIPKEPAFASSCRSMFQIAPREGDYSPLPQDLETTIRQALDSLGIKKLYSHQAEVYRYAMAGKDVVVATSTASGKSLTYMLPIFQRKLKQLDGRSLLLYPTKALSQDQQAFLHRFNEYCGTSLSIFTFDGDTPGNVRRHVRKAGDLVITNPDMLHSGILPHHTNWVRLFESLAFIVVDELHVYRGIFGSHVANLLRRLLRLCQFYGSNPQFLVCSATIGNPLAHACRLIGRNFQLVMKDGSPSAGKRLLFYNPPMVNTSPGIRHSALKEAAALGAYLLNNGISTILFCRSRLNVELLYTYLQQRCPKLHRRIRAYRGGYLAGERREIEKGLRRGDILGVVSTNALELGIDIGNLEASISVGYPGAISSLWQQFGRVGRRDRESLSILVATSSGTDQYLINHPHYLLENNPEEAICNPDNLLIINEHIKCAAFELPFHSCELFADFRETKEVLEYLASERVLKLSAEKYYWMDDLYPANSVSLRLGPHENFVVINISEKGSEELLGEVDLFSAPLMLHQHAIYMHSGQQYYVEELLWEDRQARVRRLNVDYYTDAQEKVNLAVLEKENCPSQGSFTCYRGEISLRVKALFFKKIKLESHENVGWGEITTPETEMHTEAAWLLLSPENDLFQNLLPGERGAALFAAAHAIAVVAPLYILCDPKDIRVRAEAVSATFGQPAIYFYDHFPGGLGLSYRLMANIVSVAMAARELIHHCPCRQGCPSCIGAGHREPLAKQQAVQLLSLLQEEVRFQEEPCLLKVSKMPEMPKAPKIPEIEPRIEKEIEKEKNVQKREKRIFSSPLD